MANISLQLEPLQLIPVADAAETRSPAGSSQGTASNSPSEATASPDEIATFLEIAQRELDTGWIDRPLWQSILAQAKGDDSVARSTYLEMRATVLHIEKRDGRRDVARRQASAPAAAATAPQATARAVTRRGNAHRRWLQDWRMGAAAVGALALVGIGIGFVMGSGDGDTEAANNAVIEPVQVSATARQESSRIKAAKVEAEVKAAAAAAAADDGLHARILNMVEAGNWNVVTLLASEWTRREPANADAWLQLSDGYFRLRQYPEALDASSKASQLAAGDPRAWRTLGQVYVQLDRPADALDALDKALALNGNDLQSLADVGLLNAQLARLPQAKSAFDKLLSANPEDTDAACGEAFIARSTGQAKDAEAIERKLQARDRSCAAWNERARAVKVTSVTATYKSVPALMR
ncbi:MAG: tetratricopeptide repeat protein [Casimicrobiaceae bacterium]